MKKKLFAIVMSATMVMSFMPSLAFAATHLGDHELVAESCTWADDNSSATFVAKCSVEGCSYRLGAVKAVVTIPTVDCGKEETVKAVAKVETAIEGCDVSKLEAEKDVTVKMADHDLVKTEAKAPTENKKGNLEYWTCKTCKKMFTTSEAKVETNEAEVTLDATGHVYSVDPEEVTIEGGNLVIPANSIVTDKACNTSAIVKADTNVAITETVVSPATCTEKGVVKLSASADVAVVDKSGKDAGKVKVVYELIKDGDPAKGHVSLNPGAMFVWDGYDKATAHFMYCPVCKNYWEGASVKATVTASEVPDSARCETEANRTYTAVVTDENGNEYKDTKLEKLPKLGHDYVAVPEVAATCYKDGAKAHYKCSRCGKTFVKDNQGKYVYTPLDNPALKIDCVGHVMDGTWAWEYNADGTPKSASFTPDKCSVCGKVAQYVDPIKAVITETSEATEKKAATCTETGETVFNAVVDEGDFAFKDTAVKGDIYAKDSKTVTTPKLKHHLVFVNPDKSPKFVYDWAKADYANKTVDVVAKFQKCDRDGCDYEVSYPATVTSFEVTKAPTCTELGSVKVAAKYTTTTGVVYTDAQTIGDVPVLNHRNTEVKKDNVKAPTCTEDGSHDVVKVCADCGKELDRLTVVDEALGHKEVDVEAVAPTCTETGLTAGKKCETCGEITVAQEVVPALGHKEVDIEAVAPTCTETGLTAGKKCEVCGEITVAQEKVPALGHKEEVLPAVKATATKTGLTEGKKCSVCDEVLEAQTVTVAKAKTPSVKAGKKSLTATAAKVTGATKYQVAYKRSGSKYTWKYATASAKNAQTIKNLVKGKKYYVKVRTISGDVVGAWSSTKAVKVK